MQNNSMCSKYWMFSSHRNLFRHCYHHSHCLRRISKNLECSFRFGTWIHPCRILYSWKVLLLQENRWLDWIITIIIILISIILYSNWPGFSQQSVLLDEKYLRSQLLRPHTRLPLHSESLSQSPSPSPQGPSSLVSQHSLTSECDPRAQLWYTSTYTKLG